MQNLATDFSPEFLVAEQEYIAAFNVDANGYDPRVGPPCPRHMLVAGNHARFSSFIEIPIEELDEREIHPDIAELMAGTEKMLLNIVAFFEAERSDEDIDDATVEGDPEVVAALFEFRQFYKTDAWGIELRRPARDADVAPNFTIEVPERIGLKKVAPEEIISIDGVDADTFERWLQEASGDTFCLYGDCSEDRVDCCMKEEFLPSHVGNHVPLVAHHNWRCRLNEDPRRGMSHGKWSTRQEKPWLASHDSIRHMEIAN